MTTRTRSAERTEFLEDIITAAVEGGTGYWAQVSRYKWDGCVTHATLHEMLDELDDDGHVRVGEGLELTIDKVATALGKIKAGDVKHVSAEWCKRITEASRENDAGEIDAADADNIVQVALLGGEIVYG